MAWAVPKYSRKQVNKAGDVLVEFWSGRGARPEADWLRAMHVLTNWRASHNYPINTFQATLRSKLRKIDSNALVAQRLKRAPSIIHKLMRPDRTRLARMQDIGGLRAVVSDVQCIRMLVEDYHQSRFEHDLEREDDYIERPKDSGYRSVHLVYKYRNKAPSSEPYQGLLVELQIRTRVQHAWATAVETMGTFLDQALKASEGSKDWLEFFALTGSAFAHLECTPAVQAYARMSPEETYKAVRDQAAQLDVQDRLAAFSVAAQHIGRDKYTGSYHLVILNTEEKSVTIQSFGRDRLDAANEAYADVERDISRGQPLQAVLVSTTSIDLLRTAYPSYFLDTGEFIKNLNQLIGLSNEPTKQTASGRRRAPKESRS